MNKKKILIIFSVLMLFLMITSVSAKDIDTTDKKLDATDSKEIIGSVDGSSDYNNHVKDKLSSNSDDKLKLENNSKDKLSAGGDNDVLGASINVNTFSALSSALSNSAYSEINIVGNITFTGSLTITRSNLIINGNGNTLNGNNQYRIFYIDSSQSRVTLKNITFKNGLSPAPGSGQDSNRVSCGGAVDFRSSQYCVVDSCTFLNCYSNYGGGALHFSEGSQHNTISNCVFKNNRALISGGAIRIRTTTSQESMYNTIKNCYFEYNRAGFDTSRGGSGGAIEFYTGNSLLDNCTFIRNSIVSSPSAAFGACGGAVELYENSKNNVFKNSIFINNSAPYANGGAFAINRDTSSNTTIMNCSFIGNKAVSGGAIYFNAANSNIISCFFANDSATTSGGAVYSASVGSVVDSCVFKNCTAPSSNYFYQGNPITFRNTYFPEVYVGNDGATGDSLDPNSLGSFSTAMSLVETNGIMYIVGSLTNFQNHNVNRAITIKPYNKNSNINLAGFNNRAFTITASGVTIRDLTFKNSKYSGDGGVIYWNADNGHVYNCTFTDNKLTGSSSKGGAIMVTGNSDIFIVESCTFSGNDAYDGGSIYVNDVTNNTLILKSNFVSGKATHYGGALYYKGKICYYVDDDTVFAANTASADSRYKDIYDAQTTKCIMNVYVSLDGTGDGSSFDNPTNFNTGFNKVAPGGRITFVKANEVYNLNSNYAIGKFAISFYGNNSTLKGASFTIAPAAYNINFNNLIFKSNSINAIVWKGMGGNVVNCSFIDNGGSGGLKGSAIQGTGNNLTIKNSVFENNRALSSNADGGAIWYDASDLTVINCNFTNNRASLAGTHIYLTDNVKRIIINSSSFINGVRTGTGSAIILTNGTIELNNCIFDGNTGELGGALRLLDGSVAVENCSFSNNKAIYGGAIYSNIALLLTGSNFTLNEADYGGALYLNAKSNNLSGLIFNGNIAKTASAIYFNTTQNVLFKDIKFLQNKATVDATVLFTNNCNVYNDEKVLFSGNILPTASSLNVVVPTGTQIYANVYYVSNNGGGTGLTWGTDTTTLDYALGHIFDGGKIFFSQGTYDFETVLSISKNLAFIGNQSIFKRKDGNTNKYLFALNNGITLNVSDFILNSGIKVTSGTTVNLDNITLTGTSVNDGGVIFEAGSSGSIKNSKFTGINALADNHVVTINSNINIDNSEFTKNSLDYSPLYYGTTGRGQISNSTFVNNSASSDVRNVYITNINNVVLSKNNFDVNLTYKVSNTTYGSKANITGTFDAGVNFEIVNVNIVINDTAHTNATYTIGSDHKFTLDISGKLGAGYYYLNATGHDDSKYYVIGSSNLFEIIKANISINDIGDITLSYGDNDTVVIAGSVNNLIKYGNNYTGNVSVVIANNAPVKATVFKNGTFTLTVNVKGFNAGNYDLNITVEGNDNYTSVNKKFTNYLTVVPATVDVTSIDNITVDYGIGSILVNGTLNSTKFGVNYTGIVTVTVAGLTNTVRVVNNTFSVRFTNSTPFKAGKYDVVVSGEAIDNYNAIASKTFDDVLEVKAIVPEFVITSPSIGYGENATVYISLPKDATGKVVINASGKYVVVIDDVYGITNATIVLPVSGSYLINATYYGDNNYQNVSTNSTLFVERPRSALNITVADSFVGSDILINFTIKSAITGEFFNDASGELRVYVGSKFYVINVTDGRANLTVSDLSISSYNVVAIYSGDQNYAGCDGYSKFEVKGYETSLIITLGSDEILVDKSLKVTVSVNETINNAPIYLYVDGVLYNILLTKDGISVFNVTGLKAGVHNIEAVFPSTSAFGNVSNKTSVSVIKNNPNFSAEAIANSTNDVFIRFILPDDATGVINVTYGGALIKSVVVDANRTINLGKYSIMGNYTFDIVYSGDEKYFNVSSSSTVEVGKISDYVMNITSTVVVRNKDVTIFVNLPSEFMNNGTVNLTINGNYEVLSLVNSQVNKTIATTGLGEINVVAVYSGFDIYASKTVSKVFEFKPTDEYDIRIIVDDVCVGDNVTIKISAPNEIKNVTLRVDGLVEIIKLVNGNGTYNLSNIALGYHAISVSYDGDEVYYAAKTFYGGFNVTRKTPVIVVIPTDNVKYGSPVLVSVDLGESDVTGLVQVILDDVSYNYFRLNEGRVEFNITNLKAGTHNISVKYDGDTKYSNVTSDIVKFNVSMVDTYEMNLFFDSDKVTEGAVIESVDGSSRIIRVELPKDATGNVLLFVDNNLVDTVNCNSTLIFTLKGNYNGIHNLTVNYTGDSNYNSSAINFKVNMTSKMNATLKIIVPDVVRVGEKFNITVISNLGGDAEITLFIDGSKIATQLSSNNKFTIDGLSSGGHLITVDFYGNDAYRQTSNSTNIDIIKLDSKVVVSADNIDVGENLVVNVNASGNGSATIYIYNQSGSYIGEYILSINNGKGQIIVPYKFTEIGEYSINITYNGDDVYDVSKNSSSFIVQLATDYEFKIITSDALVGEDVIVNVTLPNNANNMVILTLPNGTNVSKYALNGIASFIIPNMSYGDYKVNATYVGDNNYNRATKLGKFSVYKHVSVIDLSFNTTDKSAVEIINSIVQGEKTLLIIKLANDTTGYVNVTVSSSKQFNNRYLLNGEVNITLDDLTHGNYNINVDYSGDDKYNNASASIVLIVASSKPTVEITPIADQMVGSDVKVSVKTNVDKGNVTLYLNGIEFNRTSVVNGWANFTIKSISGDLATVNVFVVYEANDEYAGAVNSTTFNVNKYPSSIEATSNKNNITVRVGINATGSVIVTFNGINYTASVNDSGVAVISLPNAPGSYKLPVYYSGDFKYYSNSTMVDVSIPWGDDYLLNATVDDTGLVTVNVDSRVNNVTISCEGLIGVITDFTVKGDVKVGYYQLPDNLAVGGHIVTVSYVGDGDLGPKAYSLIYNVEKIKDYNFNVTADAEFAGDDVIVYVNLPDDATGFVVFTIDGVGYSINLAETRNLTLSGLANGTYNVVAKYVGDGNYSESQNTTQFTLIKRQSFVNITVSDINVGGVEIIDVTVPSDVNGMVLLDINGVKYYVNIVKGTGSINITKLTNGTYTVIAFYDGNDLYDSSNATKVFNVNKLNNYIINVDYSKVVNNTTRVTVTLPDDATGLVTITVNNTNFTGIIYKGKAVIEVTNIIDVSYDYVVNWEGDDKYVPGRTTGVIYNDEFRKDSQVIVSVDDIYVGGSALIKVNVTEGATGEVRITVNGKNIILPLINGTAKYSIGGFTNGTYNVTVTYLGDNIFGQSSNSTSFKVSKYNSSITITTNGGEVGENIGIIIAGPSDASGDVEIIINGTTYGVVMNNGKALLNTTFTKYGLYNIIANYKGNAKYNSSSNVGSFNIDSLTPSVVVSVENIKVDEDAVITVYVPDDATGIVTVTVDGVDYDVTVDSGKAVFNIPNLANGTYSVLAKYNGDSKYASNTNISSFNVSKVNIMPDISSVMVDPQANITVSVPDDATGSITIYVGNDDFTSPIQSGIAFFNLNNIVNGTNVTFVYDGDDKYNGFNTSAIIYDSGIKQSSSLSIMISNIKVGENATITVGITEKATGNITIKIGDKILSNEIVGGKVTFIVSDLSYGIYNVTAVYAGDSKFLGSNITSSISVSKHVSNVIVSTGDIKVGENANITVFVVPSDATGNVTIKINGVNQDPVIVSGGKAVFVIPNLGNGTYEVVPTYNGDAKYLNSTGNTTFKVSKVDINPNIESTSVLDNKTTVTVIVPEDANGNITIIVGANKYTEQINDGKAIINVSNVGNGTNIAIVYDGDDKYNGFSRSAVVTDKGIRINPSITVVSDKSEYLAGETAVITITVPEDARGNVTIKINGEIINTTDVSQGMAVYNYTVLSSGNFNVEVVYNGDNKYGKTTNVTSFNASRVNSTVVIDVNSTSVGESIIIVVYVPVDAAGEVSIVVDAILYGKLVEDGRAVFNITALSKNNYTVVATFSSTDGKYNGNTNSTSFEVTAKSTNLDVVVNPVTYGEDANIVVNVAGNATGYVTVTIGDNTYLANVDNGTAKFSIPNLEPGVVNLEIAYSGDDNYYANTTNANITVNPKSTTIDVIAGDINKGETAVVTVIVSNDANGVVVITVGGKDYNTTINEGIASVEISGLDAGSYNIVAKYLGNKYYANSTNNTVSFNVLTDSSVVAKVVSRMYGSDYDYEAVFTDKSGKPLANTNVTFAVNGKEYNVVTDENGVARLPGGTLTVGNHTVVAKNPITGYETYNTTEIKPTLVDNKDINMDFKDGSKYSVRVIGADGKPVGAGVEVTIRINYVSYKVKTDKNGYARLSINLNPGKYTVTVTRNGYKISNEIHVKRTLAAKKTQVAKKSAKISKIKVSLKWSNGKAIKGKKVTMKFRGNLYKAKTNSKGIAVFKLPKKGIKNLKPGKTYQVKYTYLTDSIYKFIKIKK